MFPHSTPDLLNRAPSRKIKVERGSRPGPRSPHRMTRDPVTGDIWLGDVGQSTREEVTKVFRGGNLRWP